jgi:hypothetical protein
VGTFANRAVVVTGPLDERAAWRLYRFAVRRALARLHESEILCARIDAVASGIEGRRWGWSTNPAAAPSPRPPSPPARTLESRSSPSYDRRAVPAAGFR